MIPEKKPHAVTIAEFHIGGRHGGAPPEADEEEETAHAGDEQHRACRMILDAIKSDDEAKLCEGLEAFELATEAKEHEEEATEETDEGERDERDEDYSMIGGRNRQ